jgi:uncharacterized protein YndB with AHSA1/START domain
MTTTGMKIHQSVTVDVGIEKAFSVFTDRIGDWWIREHHIGNADLGSVVIEPRPGGRFYEIGTDSSQCDWGHVIAWEPPTRLVLAWQLTADWAFDPGFETEVEVWFSEIAPGKTRVDLEHRNLERFGDRSEQMAKALGSNGGWQGLLTQYAAAARPD